METKREQYILYNKFIKSQKDIQDIVKLLVKNLNEPERSIQVIIEEWVDESATPFPAFSI